jgi:hypothetical protein
MNKIVHSERRRFLPSFLAVISCQLKLEFRTEFHSEKFPRNRLTTVSVIPRKQVLILRHSGFRGRAISEAQYETERNSAKKLSFTEQSKYRTNLLLTRVMETNSYGLYKNSQFEYCQRLLLPHFVELFSLLWNGLEWNSESLLGVLRNGFPNCILFRWFGREFGEFASNFSPRGGIPSCFLFRERVRNGIPIIFCSAEQPEFRWK